MKFSKIIEGMLSEKNKGLENKSKKSGIAYGTLKKVYDRGMAAWNSGHRPGSTQQQWAMGRVNSFITGKGGARKADADLWKNRGKRKKESVDEFGGVVPANTNFPDIEATENKKKISKDYTKGLSRKKKKYGSKDAMEKEIEKYRGTDKYKKDWDADYKKGKDGKKTRVKTKRSAASKAFAKMYGESINEDYSQRARNFRVALRRRLASMKKGKKIKYGKLTFTALGNGNFKDSKGKTVPSENIVQTMKFAVQSDIMQHRGAAGDDMVDAYLKFEGKLGENVNEATSLWKHFDAKMKLQDTIMDLEYDMKTITNDLKQLHIDMEQEAEPGGGPKATRYGREIEKLEKEYKRKKIEFKKLMKKLDKMEMM